MKRALVASLLGIAACVASVTSSFGQGQIIFDNYNAVPLYSPIRYSTLPADASSLPAGHSAGELAGPTFAVHLFYGLGTVATFGGLTDSGITVNVNGSTPGYFQGPNVVIPGYNSGPVTFAVLAWDTTTGGTWDTATVRNGKTIADVRVWQEASITKPPSPSDYFQNWAPVNIVAVPEPSTFALAGLGAASLLIFRRRK